MKKIIISIFLFSFLFSQFLFGVSANITVDYSNDITGFNYKYIYGNNTGIWISPSKYTDNITKLQNTGAYVLRFPGGSLSNDYHWNGTGYYDSNGIWHPDNTNYSPGFKAEPLYRGTTSSYGIISKLTDGDTSSSSQWRSDTITASSNTIYAYVDLGVAQTVDKVILYWDNIDYATDYDIQYWSNLGSWSWAPHQGDTDYWTTIKSVSGNTGGIDTQTFTAQSIRILRIAMKKSSGTGFRLNEIEVYNGSTKLTNNVNDADNQTKAVAFSTSQSNTTTGYIPDFDFETYISLLNSLGSKAEGIVSVNFGTGTEEEAAAWVYYANIVKGYNIKYWEIGNEIEGDWESGGPVDAEYYAKRFIKFAEAMKSVDPTIKICGPVVAYLKNNSELYNGKTFIETFLDTLQAQGKLNLIDVLDFHIYANWPNTDEATTLNTPSDWTSGNNYKGYIDNIMTTYFGSADAKEVLMSEYNSGPATLVTMSFANALWVTNWLGEYIKSFGWRAHSNLWDIVNNHAYTGNYDHGYIEIGQLPSPYTYQERSTYWGIYMMNNYFTVEDEKGNTLVSATSDSSYLPVYACKRSDGKLSLMVINKDSSNSYETNITINNFSMGNTVDLFTFSKSEVSPYYIQNYLWHESSSGSYADPDLAPKQSQISVSSNSFSFTFPSYSISIFQFAPSGSTPTFTPTITPTFTPTPTYTVVVVDDCENVSSNQNYWGGYWYNYSDSYGTGTTITSQKEAGGSPQTSTGSYHATGALGTSSPPDYVYVGFGTGLSSSGSDVDISNYTGIMFYVKGDSKQYNVQITTSNITDSGYYQYSFNAPSTWSLIQIPFSSFTQPNWAAPASFDLTRAREIQWSFSTEGDNFDIYVDDVGFYGPPASSTNTPTFTPTSTLTLNNTYTPTPTSTLITNNTFTPTLTPTSEYVNKDLSNAYVYPSLIKLDKDKIIYFKNLTSYVKLYIYNISGEIIFSTKKYTDNGEISIKLSENLSAGIYLYILVDDKNNIKTGKFTIVK